jgi:hypothetical protein
MRDDRLKAFVFKIFFSYPEFEGPYSSQQELKVCQERLSDVRALSSKISSDIVTF